MTFSATFDPNQGKDGKRALDTWRLQAAVELNGLFMVDVDHLEQDYGLTARALYERSVAASCGLYDQHQSRRILYFGMTPSGDGARIVATCDPACGNLADHQQWLCSVLAVSCDKSVKNADRASYMVHNEYIYYCNPEIFTYDNEDYRKQFNHVYRSCNGAPDGHAAVQPAHADMGANVAAGTNTGPADAQGDGCHQLVLGPDYDGVDFAEIVKVYLGRYPEYQPNHRHDHLMQMARMLRYICDNNPAKLKQLVRLAPYVQQWETDEHNTREIDNLCDDACTKKYYLKKPSALRDILRRAGVKETEQTAIAEMTAQTDVALRVFARRLEPLMAEPYKSVMEHQNPMNAIPLIFASGAMFDTLLTRCWYVHYDGKPQRMNPQVLVIAPPASGKGEVADLNNWLLAPVKASDEYARKMENEYKKKCEERQTSTKAQKGDALEEPHLPIRYLTTNTSNSEFLDRLADAKELIDGEQFPLHLYMFDSELLSANKHNGGDAWIGKRDMELKAFHNEEVGRDYKNKASRNGLFYVYWNHVTTGTMVSLARKFMLQNIDDGLYMRISIAPMYNNRYQMLERGDYNKHMERRARLMSIAYTLDKIGGKLPIDDLMDYLYDVCKEACQEALDANDEIMDDLRRRAVFYAAWYTIPVMVWRAVEKHREMEAGRGEMDDVRGKMDDVRGKMDDEKTLPSVVSLVEVTEQDKQFSKVIFDAVVHFQDAFFGNMVQEARENANRNFQPRRRKTRNADNYAALPEEFSLEDIAKVCAIKKTAASTQIQRWVESGFVERVRQGIYRKIIQQII